MQAILLQAAPASTPQWMTFVLWGGIFVVMYFFMIRPQQKKQKDQKSFAESLKKGDTVVTIGGLHGRIAEVTATTVTLDVDRGTKLTFEKTAISRESSQKVQEPAEKK